MCLCFYVDYVLLWLVIIYQGVVSEWLDEFGLDCWLFGGVQVEVVDEQFIYSLFMGDVVLFKGECWEGNEGVGLVYCLL